MLQIIRLCDLCLVVCYRDAGCQAGHWNCETNLHRGQCCSVAEASEEGTGPGGGATVVNDECILISPWEL